MEKSVKKILRILETVNMKALYIAMAALFILMMMASINAVIRRAGIGGIADSLDLTRLLMVLIIFSSMAYQESKRGHVRVDMFLMMTPKWFYKIVDGFLNLLSIGILGFMTYAYFMDIERIRASGAASQVYRIPEWPFIAIVAVVLLLFTVTTLFNSIDVFFYDNKEEKPEATPEEKAQAIIENSAE